MRRVLALAVGAGLSLVSGAASAASYSRTPPINAGSYAVNGIGSAASYTRTVPVEYRTSSQRAVAMAVADAIVMGKGNIAKNARLLLRLTPSAILLTAATAGIKSLLDDALIAADGVKIERAAQSGNGTCSTGSPQVQFPNLSEQACLSRVRAFMSSIGRTYSHIQVNTLPNGSIQLVYRDTLGGSGGQMVYANQAARDLVIPATPASDADIEAAVMAAPNNDQRLNRTMDWLKQANHPLVFDGTEQASLSAPAQQTSPYNVSTTTAPNGAVSTSSTVDRVTAQAANNGAAVANNELQFRETVIVTRTDPNGTTTEETQVDLPPDPGNTPEPEPTQDQCGAPGQSPCATEEVGEFAAPEFILPGVPVAPTFSASLTRLGQGLAAAPIASIATAVSVPTGAACPVYSGTFEFVGTITFDTHCTIAEGIRPVLAAVCVLIYGIWGIRRVMSA